jgi:hypothetical protein
MNVRGTSIMMYKKMGLPYHRSLRGMLKLPKPRLEIKTNSNDFIRIGIFDVFSILDDKRRPEDFQVWGIGRKFVVF